MIIEEVQLNTLIDQWRETEEAARKATEQSDEAKQAVITAMHELGLKSQDAPAGKVTLVKTSKCNVVIERKEFEATLRNKGMYDQFTETKFSLDKVKKHVELTGDDLYGMVEIEDNYSPRFTARKVIDIVT